MADQKSPIATLKEITDKAKKYDVCVEENAKMKNDCANVLNSLCYVGNKYFNIAAALTGGSIEKMVSQKSFKGVKYFDLLKKYCDVPGGVALKQKDTSVSESESLFLVDEETSPLKKAEALKKKADEYDACVKKKGELKNEYAEYKKALCSTSKEYSSIIKDILGKKINEMSSEERDEVIAPERYAVIKEHCKISDKNDFEDQEGEEGSQDVNDILGVTESNEGGRSDL